jgi:mannonate dehydratase
MRDQLWTNLEAFLEQLLPVAEDADVVLAMHPDDPPLPSLLGNDRIMHCVEGFEHLVGLAPSPSNKVAFCQGSFAEMGVDVPAVIHQLGAHIAYVHFRNVRGKVPLYQEVFVDEGDIDMLRVVKILTDVGYDGVLIPDHTPEMTCGAPWHAGMAYALGYIRAALQAAERGLLVGIA